VFSIARYPSRHIRI